jgi:hypothetical protein
MVGSERLEVDYDGGDHLIKVCWCQVEWHRLVILH